ncbi:hypothetical protein RB653_009627 [Dictyostelium firmibasis]|uniref:DUF6748 domain-containing protein n=1 Tax=Dictyostelium firmibasis TaxID=79012 RepID=A0AAN7U211_9MYCE
MRILIFLIILIQIINIINCNDVEYFSIRKDLRKCAAPNCGGYFFKRINSGPNEKEMHVTALSLINANLKPNKMDDEKNVIVSGDITLTNKEQGFYSFFLKGIHQRMVIPPSDGSVNKGSGVLTASNKGGTLAVESYGFLSDSDVRCIRAEGCPVYELSKINRNESINFATFTEPYTTSVPLLDSDWFNSRLINTNSAYIGSIVLGSISKGELTISTIFVNTEDPASPCQQTTTNCTGGKIQTFTRSLNRCPVFDKCVNRGVCHLGVPHCPVGYTSYSLKSAPNGCLKYYCDPDSLPNPSRVLGP